MSIEALKQIWPEWQIEGRPLGKGSFGVVYKAVRRDHGVESYAAIKVISIPTDPSEVDSLRSEGLDMNATRTYLQGIVNDFVSEIQLMESLKGVQNIVSVEDYKVVEKTGEIGWDIYIRMELLTSFNAYICDKKLTEKEVIKLGCDICTALEICAKRNIIHRDIKPENIFINDFGDFKLGDFGIARKLENMTGGLSQKGTFNYMAPEVANGSEYDARVDTYSLGIVLYRLLNGNRLPFLDTEKQLLNPNERRNAVDRRLRGEELPAPCDASPAMADLILRACAYDPNMRFASATEMKQALMSVANGTYQIGACNLDRTTSVRKAAGSYDKTTSVRKAPAASNQRSTPTVNTFGSVPKKKSKVPVVIVSVLAVMILVGAGIFAIPKLLDGDDSANPSETSSETTSETTDYSEFDEEQIASIISEADALAAEEDYEGALAKIQTGLTIYPKSEELQDKADEYTAQLKAKTLDEAKALADSSDYIGAITKIQETETVIGEDAELTSAKKEYEDLYVTSVIEEADTLISNGEDDSALDLLNNAAQVVPNNKYIQAKIESLTPLCMVDAVPAYQNGGNPYKEYSAIKSGNSEHFSMAGVKYYNGMTFDADYNVLDDVSWAVYNLDKNYRKLEFTVCHVDETDTGDKNTLQVIYDGVVKEEIELSPDMAPKSISLDVSDVTQLKLQIGASGGNHPLYGLGNPVLFSAGVPQAESANDNTVKKYMTDILPAYQNGGNPYKEYSAIKSGNSEHFSMAGVKYYNGMTFDADYNVLDDVSWAVYNLDKNYRKLEFTVCHVDETDTGDKNTLQVIYDGVVKEEIELSPDMAPKSISLDVSDVTQLKLQIGASGGNHPLYGLGNPVLE